MPKKPKKVPKPKRHGTSLHLERILRLGRIKTKYRANPTEEQLWAYDVENDEMFTVETKAELKQITPALLAGDILLVRAIDPEAAEYKFDRYEDNYITIVEAREWLDEY